MKYKTKNVGETEDLGRELAKSLKRGDVVALYGDLGAGKTAFTRGIAAGLGVDIPVTSPTYTIVNEYDGKTALFHFDMYRLRNSDDLFNIGWDDYLERDGVCVVEWSERISDALEGAVKVIIERVSDNERQIDIDGGEGFVYPCT